MAFRFECLDIWQYGAGYAGKIYTVTARLLGEERFGLAVQLGRAANSISLNIPEGSGRDTNKDFDRFLGIALGSVLGWSPGLFLALDSFRCKTLECTSSAGAESRWLKTTG